jgi:putative oxidoreductase
LEDMNMTTITNKFPLVARLLLGAVFVVFGLTKVLHFIPQPMHAGAAATYFAGLAASGYIFPLLIVIEVVAGALLIAGRFVPLALTLLAPVLVNIAGFHFVLAPEGAPVALVLLALELYLAWFYRSAFAPLLQMKATPASAATSDGRPASFAEAR